jgi:uncharacterized protein (DUF433 family)
MNEEMGLAQGMQGQQAPQGQMPTVQQLVELIRQGVTPEELLENGVPEELVMAAMDALSQEVTQVPAGQEGLAGAMVRPEQM